MTDTYLSFYFVLLTCNVCNVIDRILRLSMRSVKREILDRILHAVYGLSKIDPIYAITTPILTPWTDETDCATARNLPLINAYLNHSYRTGNTVLAWSGAWIPLCTYISSTSSGLWLLVKDFWSYVVLVDFIWPTNNLISVGWSTKCILFSVVTTFPCTPVLY